METAEKRQKYKKHGSRFPTPHMGAHGERGVVRALCRSLARTTLNRRSHSGHQRLCGNLQKRRLGFARLKVQTSNYAIGRAGWVLINSVLNSSATYFLTAFAPNKWMMKKFDKLRTNFLWNAVVHPELDPLPSS